MKIKVETDEVNVERAGTEVSDQELGDYSLANLSDTDKKFLVGLLGPFESHLASRKGLAQQHLQSVLEQSEKCQCSSCQLLAQALLTDYTRKWGA